MNNCFNKTICLDGVQIQVKMSTLLLLTENIYNVERLANMEKISL